MPEYEYKVYKTAELYNSEDPNKAVDIEEAKKTLSLMDKLLKKSMVRYYDASIENDLARNTI